MKLLVTVMSAKNFIETLQMPREWMEAKLTRKKEIIYLVRTENLSEKLPPDTFTYVCVSRGKNC